MATLLGLSARESSHTDALKFLLRLTVIGDSSKGTTQALRDDPGPVEHLEGIIRALDSPPIIMGHSFGGTLVQILLDHGFGAAGMTRWAVR